MAVEIKKTVRGHTGDLAWLRRRAQRLIRDLSRFPVPGAAALSAVELSILLTGSARIRTLNRRWRKKDKVTDVLSFPQLMAPELRRLARAAGRGGIAPWWLGDVVICLPRASRQAKEHGHSLRAELELLLAHGILHLLDYDHERGPAAAKKMRQLEQELLGRTMIF